MKKSRVISISLAVVLAAIGGLWLVRHRESKPTPREPAHEAKPHAAVTRDKVEPAQLVVTVRDASGPLAGATVRLERDRGEVTIVTTGRDGVAKGAGLEPGSWHVSATADGHEPSALPARALHAGETIEVKLELAAGGRLLTGTVTDATGGPIGGARIDAAKLGSLARPSDAVASTVTGADGKYKLTVAAGQLLVAASEASYAPQARYVEVGAGGATADFQLVPGGVIEGIVRDERSHEPVAGAEVEAERDTAAMLLGERAHHRVTAGGDGRFRITGLRPGAYELDAHVDRRGTRAPTVVGIGVAEQVSDVELLVGNMPIVRGVVLDENNAPVPRIEVDAFGEGAGGTATSDAKGAFVIEGVAAGHYMVVGHNDEFLPAGTTRLDVETKDVDGLKVHVHRGLRVKGHVEPRQPCEISVDDSSRGGDMRTMIAPITTTADGEFELAHVDSADYVLDARCASGDQGHKTISVKPAMPEVIVEVKPGASIAGHVVDGNGKPVAGVAVMADAVTTKRTTIVNGRVTSGVQAIADAAGAFELRGLTAQAYHLLVLDRGRPLPMKSTVTVTVTATEHKTGVVLAVDRPDGVIRGVVTGPDGKPLADAWVSVHQDFADLVAGMRPEPGDSRMVTIEARDDSGDATTLAPALTDATGKFEIAGLPRVPWTVLAEAQAGKLRGRATKVVPDAQIQIQTGGVTELRGVVRAPRGVPSGFHVALDGPTQAARSFSSTDGTFSFGRVDPGDYTVTVTSTAGNGKATVKVVSGQQASVQIDLAANATVIGKLVDPAGKPLAGLPLTIVPDAGDGRLKLELSGPPPTTNPDGTFRLEAKAGPSALLVLTPPRPFSKHGLMLEAGKTLDVGAVTVDTGAPGH